MHYTWTRPHQVAIQLHNSVGIWIDKIACWFRTHPYVTWCCRAGGSTTQRCYTIIPRIHPEQISFWPIGGRGIRDVFGPGSSRLNRHARWDSHRWIHCGVFTSGPQSSWTREADCNLSKTGRWHHSRKGIASLCNWKGKNAFQTYKIILRLTHTRGCASMCGLDDLSFTGCGDSIQILVPVWF